MCKICGYKYGSNKHQLYWLKYFLIHRDFEKAKTTFYHLINRKAYRKWFAEHHREDKYSMIYNELNNNILRSDHPDEYVEYLCNIDTVDYFNEWYNLK